MSDTVAALPLDLPPGVEVTGPPVPGWERVLTREALSFLADLQRRYGRARESLLAERAGRQEALDLGAKLTFPPETSEIRAERLAGRATRRGTSSIDGSRSPARPSRKMMINALNSGARVFMADFEDALSPTWANVIEAQTTCRTRSAARSRSTSPEGKSYRLGERRRRCWCGRVAGTSTESHLARRRRADVGAACSTSGCTSSTTPRELLRARQRARTSTCPSSRATSRRALWNDVFVVPRTRSASRAGRSARPSSSRRILAAFEMDEILYELRDHAAGLNAGRWDYLFSIIKTFRTDPRWRCRTARS